MKFGRPIVPRRSTKCVECNSAFESYTTYLAFDEESETWLRYDYCCPCWEQVKAGKEGCVWTGRLPPKTAPTPDEEALRLLREESDVKIRFVLALYLERTKGLCKRTELTKGDSLFFEVPHTGDVLEITPCLVTPAESAEITRELALRLNVPSAC